MFFTRALKTIAPRAAMIGSLRGGNAFLQKYKRNVYFSVSDQGKGEISAKCIIRQLLKFGFEAQTLEEERDLPT